MRQELRRFIRHPRKALVDFHISRIEGLVTNKPHAAGRAYQIAHSFLTRRSQAEGFSKYTVVSAVYNVGPYLEQYFMSLVRQTLDFKRNVFLVMVDDGSTDDSKQIIQQWQKRFPHNITYVYKENGGQASARNVGLKHVNTDWVTFIDPDDFVSTFYFDRVDRFLATNRTHNTRMVATNLIFYFEDTKHFKDTHPLRHKYANGSASYSINDLGKSIQLSGSSAFFLASDLQKHSIIFDTRVKPAFEDGHFIGTYLLSQRSGNVSFIASAKYYYRKRMDGSSTLDTAWTKKGKYLDVLKYGHLDLIKKSRSEVGCVPGFVQMTILYDLMWIIRRVINNPERVNLLNTAEKAHFVHLLDQILSFIEPETVFNFELAGADFFHNVGMLHCFKQTEPEFQIVYVEAYDPIKSQIQLRYFTGEQELEAVLIDGQDTMPRVAKTITHDFLDRVFVQERRLWVDLPDQNLKGHLRVRIGRHEAQVSLRGELHQSGIELATITKAFNQGRGPTTLAPFDIRYQNASDVCYWLFMDRSTQADDNAEHLYRYVMQNYPKQPIVFALDRDSRDWDRLDNEGFNLVAFGSKEHEAALRGCDKIVSSHIDGYVNNYFKDGSLYNKHFVFLQHGITKDDLSRWLNTTQRIDLFVTAARPEAESISSHGARYIFTRKEVRLTGFARHDALLSKDHVVEKVILIAPTWRNNLMGAVINGNTHELNPDFMTSTYAKSWSSLLQSRQLKRLAENFGYKIYFMPHVNIEPYLPQFEVPDYVDTGRRVNESIQDVMRRSALLVTDYSSLAFEFALLKKPVLYYQFDQDEIANGAHTYQKGYFDYAEHGFGPVVESEAEALAALDELLAADGQIHSNYRARIEGFFAYFDTNNCERVYQAIKDLDRAECDLEYDFAEALAQARLASSEEWWRLAAERWHHIARWAASNSELAIYLGEASAAIRCAEQSLDGADGLF